MLKSGFSFYFKNSPRSLQRPCEMRVSPVFLGVVIVSFWISDSKQGPSQESHYSGRAYGLSYFG